MTTTEQELLDQTSCNVDGGHARATSPIFILGIAPRCGTNYLHDLIRMHPDCDSGSSVLEEDHLVANARLLMKYVDGVSRRWNRALGANELQFEKAALAKGLGQGLMTFLRDQLERRKQLAGNKGGAGSLRRLVTKTPSVKNLELFSRLFPESPLLILVRDGRSVVESSAKTFNHPHGYAAREWARAARIILDFQSQNPGSKHLLVRYEDLYCNLETELRRIFAYLKLDPASYDYSAAANLPVRGSSTFRGQPTSYHVSWVAEGIHWQPVQKPQSFNPVERWAGWTRAKHERFNWLAGEPLERFGYARKNAPGGRLFWWVWNLMLDLTCVETATWSWRRVRRRWKSIESASDFWAFLRSLKQTMIEAIWERTELGI